MTSRCWLRARFRSKSRVLHRLKEPFGELPESPPRSCPAALFSCYTARIPPVERERATRDGGRGSRRVATKTGAAGASPSHEPVGETAAQVVMHDRPS